VIASTDNAIRMSQPSRAGQLLSRSSHPVRHYRRRQTTQTPTQSASLSPGERNHPWPINFGSAAGCNFAYQEKLVLDDRCELDHPLTRNEGTADVEHPVGVSEW
jgi:hypothetical protein